jgi:hypothetical protein
MVFGRTRKTPTGRTVQVPADQWLWSPQPTHPAIITRQLWDAAQAVGTEHSTSRDGTDANTHRQTRRSYILRSRVRCRSCKRRMSGITRTSRRYWAEGPDYASTYYTCSHDPDDPRHTAPEGHPRTISVRDHLLPAIHDFFATRVFGPDRAALLAADQPASAADDKARRDRQAAALSKTDPGPGDPALLDALPILGNLLPSAPARLQQQLYDAFDLQALYKKNMHQVTIHITITDSTTPQAVAAIIINDASDHPGSTAPEPAPQAPFSDLTQAPTWSLSSQILKTGSARRRRTPSAWAGHRMLALTSLSP